MEYLEISFLSNEQDTYDILMAGLSDIGFDSFTEEEGNLKAYIPLQAYDEALFNEYINDSRQRLNFSYTSKNIPYENWNAVWESNFQPISIGNKLRVRAVFHEPDPSFEMELVIQPKMSFGTGHHATTWLVMDSLLKTSVAGKKVMDFGTGTGILIILAQKLGASPCFAVDNDPNCIENSEENFQLNHTGNIMLKLGDIRSFDETDYDIIIGNITRNVIIEFLPEISSRLKKAGSFIGSGFYESDLEILKEKASAFGLNLIHTTTKDQWCTATFNKE